MRSFRSIFGVALPGALACNAPAHEGFTTVSFERDTSSSTTGGDPTAVVPTEPTPPTDATTAPEDPGSTGVNAKPVIAAFSVDETEVTQAQNVTLRLTASADVVSVDILLNGAHQATVAPSQFPYAFPITSQSVCHGTGTFTAVVRDDRDQIDTADADPLHCALPGSGSSIFLKVLPGASGSGFFGVTILPDEDIAIAGVLDDKMAVWRLAPDGEVRPGWPKKLGDWTSQAGLGALSSIATAIASDASGTIAVVGVLGSGATSRYYAALLNGQGAPIWEDVGNVDGEEAAGVKISASGLVFVVGSIRTSAPADPPAYDGLVRGYPVGYPLQAERWQDKLGAPATDPILDEFNERSERGRGAACLAGGECVVVGEREFNGGLLWKTPRAYAQRYTATGARAGEMWTADGSKFAESAANAVCRTPSGFAMTGWGRHDDPGAQAQLFTQALDLEDELLWSSSEPTPAEAKGNGIAIDNEGKLVHAGLLALAGQTDAWSFASPGPGEPLVGAHTFDGGGTFDFAAAVAVGAWGHYVWVGVTEVDGKLAGVVSKRNP